MIYAWPTSSELFGCWADRVGFDSKLYLIRQIIRYKLRCLRAKKQIKQFVNFVNQDDRLVDFFNAHKSGSYRIIASNFINSHFNAKERLECVQYNTESLRKLPCRLWQTIFSLNQEKELFVSLWGLTVILKINGTFEEGFFALELKMENQRFYGLSFAFVELEGKRAMLIPSLQGLSQGKTTQEMIKQVTKKCFGLRPQMLLVEIARFLMIEFGSERLLGITQTSQVRYAPFGKKGYYVDYNALWKECGGQMRGDYFDISLEQRKSLDEIPSQKRSMYKKRFEFLDDVKNTVLKNIREERCL